MLRKRLYDHDHGSSNSMPTKGVPHGKLLELFDPQDLGIIATNLLNGTSFQFDSSGIDFDGHPQYLHRGGVGSGVYRDKYLNGMYGNLLFLNKDETTDHQNIAGDSFRICFGSNPYGPTMFYDKGSNSLRLGDVQSGGNIKVTATDVGPSPNNDAIFGYSSTTEATGYGAVRRLALAPQDFVVFYTDEVGNFYQVAANRVADEVRFLDKDGTYGFQAQALGIASNAGYYNYAVRPINLPFTKYTIVNVLMRVYLTPGSWTAGKYRVSYGYQDIPIYGAGGGAEPTGATITSADLNTVFGSIGTGVWSNLAPVFTVQTTTTYFEVDNSNYLLAGKSPVLCFRFDNTVPPYQPMYIGDIIVLYRVKEF
jgi:hypothetical protein